MLKFQDYIAKATEEAAKVVFRYAKAVPADKLEWEPAEGARSVLDQCRELAMCPTWGAQVITGEMPEWTEEVMAKIKEEQSQWTTVEQCEKVCFERLPALLDLIRNMPDERLSETKFLPFEGGREFSLVEQMEYPKWNFDYHCGQIAYVQTLYGDKEMH